MKTVDSLSIDIIHNIPDDANFKGGVRDLGKFSEGYCFEVKTTEPLGFFETSEKEPVPLKGTEKEWFICSDTEDIKNKFMNLIIKLRLKKQHKVGLYFRKNDPPKKPNIGNLFNKGGDSPAGLNGTAQVKNVLDGYWVLLQDWSSCSKICGGGLQFQQLMCVPPKQGGKPCEGEAFRQRVCNEQPCPYVSDAAQVLPKQSNGPKMEKPIVRMMPISSRPLRYDKCHLKEGDTIFTKHKRGVGIQDNPMKIPARIVMNEKSVSVFTDDTLLTELGTFIIEKTIFKLSERKDCFVLDSETIKGEFCVLDGTNAKSGNFVDEWNYDFNLFKNQCHTLRKTIALNDSEEKALNDELNKKIESAKLDIVKERQVKIQQKVKEEGPISKVEKVQETAMLAMKKELNIDELLQKEELEKEEQETRELKAQIESEKKKDECLIKSIKEKELEDQYNINKAQQEKEVQIAREEAKQQILKKRQQIKIKILQMRKRAERKKSLLNGEIQTLRTQMAGSLTKMNKEGRMDNCFRPTNTEDSKKKILKYCSTNFSDSSPSKFNECINLSTYCYVCCETEFGDMHIKEREKCYDMCDTAPKEPPKIEGSWQWVNPVQ